MHLPSLKRRPPSSSRFYDAQPCTAFVRLAPAMLASLGVACSDGSSGLRSSSMGDEMVEHGNSVVLDSPGQTWDRR
jgi:hypothetical protein